MFESEISPDLRGLASPVMNLHVTVRVTLHFNETVRSWWGLGVANHILREDPSNMIIIGRFFSWGGSKDSARTSNAAASVTNTTGENTQATGDTLNNDFDWPQVRQRESRSI